ncbi:shikimate kinase [Ornithinibacillus salinisoli]|uniref:Shikimate kinase n=1 Tax=Ornithinibacillus salinisoli TaxID=1848459 RepID=A0ABW4W2S5_9BACI
MECIYLIGFMGSGKSTIGKLLSRVLDVPFMDTDEYIVEKNQMKINDIFEKEGEIAFRNYESQALKASKSGVISTGGGIVENEDNMKWMKQNGVIVYLQTSFEEISNRLKEDPTRPLWNKRIKERHELFHQRCNMYSKCADYIVTTDKKSVENIVDDIKERIYE